MQKRQTGLSLIELMVGLVLGLVLIGAVFQLFQGTRLTFTHSEALARVQESGRFALAILRPDIREVSAAGFCAGDVPVTNHLNTGCADYIDELFDPGQALLGYEFDDTGRFDAYDIPDDLEPVGQVVGQWESRIRAGGTMNLPETLEDRVVPGSDVLIFRRSEVIGGVTAAGPTAASAASITLDNDHGLPQNATVLISNCSNAADLFQNVGSSGLGADQLSANASSCTSPGPGNVALNWSTSYQPGMQVFRVRTHAYYVGFSAAREESGLYRLDLSTGTSAPIAEELVEGVESMQVLYGMSNPAPLGDGQTVDFWLPADEVSDWRLVIAARVSLLVRSPATSGSDRVAQTFELGTAELTTPADGRLRQVFSTTLTLRNRQLTL